MEGRRLDYAGGASEGKVFVLVASRTIWYAGGFLSPDPVVSYMGRRQQASYAHTQAPLGHWTRRGFSEAPLKKACVYERHSLSTVEHAARFISEWQIYRTLCPHLEAHGHRRLASAAAAAAAAAATTRADAPLVAAPAQEGESGAWLAGARGLPGERSRGCGERTRVMPYMQEGGQNVL